jgi:hypothetical protein
VKRFSEEHTLELAPRDHAQTKSVPLPKAASAGGGADANFGNQRNTRSMNPAPDRASVGGAPALSAMRA